MTVILGLGNPGAKYEHTRHNVGFDAAEKISAFFQKKLRKRCFRLYRQAKLKNALVIQPLTYMNESGKIIRYFNPDDHFVVICDNMDLACGGLRIREGGGNSGQKGLASISEALGRSDFLRIYIGIGRPQDGTDVADHVLSREERESYRQALEKSIDDAVTAAIRYIDGASVGELQCEFNRKGLL